MSGENKNLLGSFNILKLIKLCLRYWYIFVITVLGCTFVMGVLSILKPQKVEVLAQLMLKDDTGSSSMLMAGQIARSFSLGDMFGGSSTTDNETFVIKSHTVFTQTARQLNLNVAYYTKRFGLVWNEINSKVPLRLTVPAEMNDTLSQFLVFRLSRLDNGNFDVKLKVKRKQIAEVNDKPLPLVMNTPFGDFSISATEYMSDCKSNKFQITLCSYDAAGSAYEKAVNVYVPDRRSDFIDISFPTYDPEFGKLLISTIINNYNDLSNVYKFDRSAQSLRLVDDRLASLERELAVSEADLEKFKKQNNLTDVEVDAQYLMTKTGTLESSLFEAQTNYEVVKLTKDFISNPANNYSLIPELYVSASSANGEAPGSSQIAQYNQLILQRMELLSSAKGNSTVVKQIDQQIDALRANIVTSINRAYQNASLVLRDLKNEDIKNKSRIGQLPTLERQYIVLKRDNLLQEQIYLFLLQQREELNMSLASRALPAQIIDQPYVLPDKPGLSRKMMLAVGVLLGLMLGLAYVLFVKMRKAPLISRSEIDSLLKAPTLQWLNNDPDASKGFSVSPEDANGETIRRLRSDLQFELASCDGKVAVVTSANDGEGKTYVATNLAASLANTGKRVVLVDVALRDPQVADNLGINVNAPIFSDYVYDGGDINATDVPVGSHTSLTVIATKAKNDNTADLIASDRFAQLISQLRTDYDYVIIDSSRINGYSDVFYLTALADITLIVARAGVVKASDVETINKLYADGRLKRIAVVENAFK